MKALAERGFASPTDSEVEAAIEAGSAFGYLQMPAARIGETSRIFRVSDSHPLISMATMIAPSPDWFIGFHDVDLRDGGDWVGEATMDAWPYDAGTDSGTTYRSPDEVTEPFEPMFRITDGVMEGAPRFGHYTISLASIPGDLDESGALDNRDIRFLCTNLGTSDARFEYTGDDTVTVDDLEVFVETRLGTRMGDTNLDGRVNFDDFLALSNNFGRDFRDWARGDSDCNEIINFADFLALSNNFGFVAEGASGEAAAVPEPSAFYLGSLFFGLALHRRKRS